MWKLFSVLLAIGVVVNISALLSEFSTWRLILLVFNVAVCGGSIYLATKERHPVKEIKSRQ